MKRVLAGLLAGGVLGSTGVALAAHGAAHGNATPLAAGQAVSFAGLTCTAYAGSTVSNSNVVCVRSNLKGYGVVVSQETVIVAKQVNGKVKVLYKVKNG